jgi:hypothetical protein
MVQTYQYENDDQEVKRGATVIHSLLRRGNWARGRELKAILTYHVM